MAKLGDRGGKKERPKDTKKALGRIIAYLKPFRWGCSSSASAPFWGTSAP